MWSGGLSSARHGSVGGRQNEAGTSGRLDAAERTGRQAREERWGAGNGWWCGSDIYSRG
jgi:hypothetical protein